MPTSRLAEPLNIDDLLNYRLSRLLAISGGLVTRLCEGGYGITRREWRLLALLALTDAMSPSELAVRAHLDRARVSRTITALARKQLVARVVRPDDRRHARVALTDAGRRVYAEMFPRVAHLNREVTTVLSPAQAQAFDAALEALTARAEALAREQPVTEHADRRHGGTRRHWPRAEE